MVSMPRAAARTDSGSSGFQVTISARGSLPNAVFRLDSERPTTRYGVPWARKAVATLLPIAPAAPKRAIFAILELLDEHRSLNNVHNMLYVQMVKCDNLLMATADRKLREKQELRSLILEAARRIVFREGFA